MAEVLKKIGLGILVSLYFFPVSFTFLPAINTKMMLAVVGLLLFALRLNRREAGKVSIWVLVSSCIALTFSLLCFMSAIIFQTGDDSYSTYFASFFVWIFGAYAICDLIRRKNGVADLRTITYYLATVAVIQCILAQLVSDIPAFGSIIDAIFKQDQEFIHEVNRIYGIGASLDSGGVRFSIILVLISYFIIDNSEEEGHTAEQWMLIPAFIIITIFGNMIARTTTVGAVLGICYIMIKAAVHTGIEVRKSKIKTLATIILIIGATIVLFSYLYVSNANMQSELRFAFEGFFNWMETGDFRTASTDKLNSTMWIWPNDSTTWLIGTGKFGSWVFGTDIGYCRFTLYCGLIGLSVFALFFCYNAYCFNKKFDNVGLLAIMLLSLTFIIWLKVSTDIFQIYAILMSADAVIRTDRK